MDARVRTHGYAFSWLYVRSRSRLFSVLWKAIMPDYCIHDDLPEPSRCWVDTNSVSPALNRFLWLQSAMLSRLLYRFQSSISINLCLHMITSDHWPDYDTLCQHPHEKCATMILSNLALICYLCVNMDVRTSTYWSAFSCLYIWLLYWVL